MSRSYSDRVMRFRMGVYAARNRLTPGCQLMLLRLSDDMNANAITSVPRSRLAKDLDCPPARITEWIKQATDEGFLSRVRRGRPGVTAVYQGLVVEVRPGVPSQRYATANQAEVRPGVPAKRTQRYAPAVPQERQPTGTSSASPGLANEKQHRRREGDGTDRASVRVEVDYLADERRDRDRDRDREERTA